MLLPVNHIGKTPPYIYKTVHRTWRIVFPSLTLFLTFLLLLVDNRKDFEFFFLNSRVLFFFVSRSLSLSFDILFFSFSSFLFSSLEPCGWLSRAATASPEKLVMAVASVSQVSHDVFYAAEVNESSEFCNKQNFFSPISVSEKKY